MNSSTEHDIAILSDLRLPGESTASMAEEVRAQAAAGYRTALVHVSSPLVEGNVGVARPLRRCVDEGLADLVTREPVRARLAVVRQPSAFAGPPRVPLDERAERVVVVAGEASDPGGRPYYDPGLVSTTVNAVLGAGAVWYPLGPRARRSLGPSWLHGITVADEDWRSAAHGRRIYLRWLRALTGGPSGRARAVPSWRRLGDRTRVMFVSSNGAGMGHLTRQLAMARRASSGIEPVFLSMSQAVPVVERYGFPWQYCPSRGDLDVDAAPWNEFFAERLVDAVRTFEPRALVFDGTWPYRGLRAARGQFPDLVYVWSRRAMWRADTDAGRLDHPGLFDLVVEPGELAAEFDRGPTVGRGDAHTVGPVTLLNRSELLDREQARAELGMDPQAPALLIMLGAGNINDITSDLDIVANEIGPWDGWHVYATSAPIARRRTMARAGIQVLSTYPLARYLRGLDAAVAASGYNSYHELVMAGVPTIFVPNLETATDDQLARAAFAEEAGVGRCMRQVASDAVSEAFKPLTDPAASAAMRERARDMYPENGAAAAMRLVEELVAPHRVFDGVTS